MGEAPVALKEDRTLFGLIRTVDRRVKRIYSRLYPKAGDEAKETAQPKNTIIEAKIRLEEINKLLGEIDECLQQLGGRGLGK